MNLQGSADRFNHDAHCGNFLGNGDGHPETNNMKTPAIALAGWQHFIGGLPITIIAVWLEYNLWPGMIDTISLAAIFSTILILIYPIIFCWITWFHIVAAMPVPVAAISIMLVPVIGVFSGHIILHEPAGLHEITGLLLICSALALVLLPSFRHRHK
jgi:drug/metabolite transporter (DMT)-like permease